jgi:hypothetical protein
MSYLVNPMKHLKCGYLHMLMITMFTCTRFIRTLL